MRTQKRRGARDKRPRNEDALEAGKRSAGIFRLGFQRGVTDPRWLRLSPEAAKMLTAFRFGRSTDLIPGLHLLDGPHALAQQAGLAVDSGRAEELWREIESGPLASAASPPIVEWPIVFSPEEFNDNCQVTGMEAATILGWGRAWQAIPGHPAKQRVWEHIDTFLGRLDRLYGIPDTEDRPKVSRVVAFRTIAPDERPGADFDDGFRDLDGGRIGHVDSLSR